MQIRHQIILTLLTIVTMIPINASALDVIINDTRINNFYLDALQLILKKSGKEVKLIIQSDTALSQARKVAHVKSGLSDVMYAGTSAELEKTLTPIRFPVTRGLISKRLFIINKQNQQLYHTIKDLDGLRSCTGIQGLGWSDTQILESVGLKQFSMKYDDIFRIINGGSKYYFSRGVTEVFHEVSSHQKAMPNLMVEESLLLEYKTAIFFFITPTNTKLKEILTTGFTTAYNDGSYHSFFYNHPMIKDALQKSDMSNRRHIQIPNPFLTPETSKIPQKYWHEDTTTPHSK